MNNNQQTLYKNLRERLVEQQDETSIATLDMWSKEIEDLQSSPESFLHVAIPEFVGKYKELFTQDTMMVFFDIPPSDVQFFKYLLKHITEVNQKVEKNNSFSEKSIVPVKKMFDDFHNRMLSRKIYDENTISRLQFLSSFVPKSEIHAISSIRFGEIPPKILTITSKVLTSNPSTIDLIDIMNNKWIPSISNSKGIKNVKKI